MEFIAFLIHIFLGFLLGNGLLKYIANNEESPMLHFWFALLLGILIETTIGFFVLWTGNPIVIATISVIVLAVTLNIHHIFLFFRNIPTALSTITYSVRQLKTFTWYVWILGIIILEKIYFVLWQLLYTPTYHTDTLKHWSTQAKAIYSGLNWSMDPVSSDFLARRLETITEYPLQLPIYRAIQATINFEWNEFVSRSDGLIFLLIICGIVGTMFYQFTQRRWMALGAILIIISLPLQVWQAASGYGDIALEAYLVAVVASFIKKEWWLCGFFMTGAIWCKNDGLALYLPGVLLAGAAYHLFAVNRNIKERIKPIGQFIAGLSLIFPWLVFQGLYSHSVFSKMLSPVKKLIGYYDSNDYQTILTQVGKKFERSPASYQLFWEYVIMGSTSSVFWLAIVISLLSFFLKLLGDQIGRSLLLFFISSCFIIYYVFTYTPAYEFLLIQTTIHRTMLQFSAAALLVVGYGLSLNLLGQQTNLVIEDRKFKARSKNK